MAPPEPLRFEPLTLIVAPEFWHELARRKIDALRLSTDPVPVVAYAPWDSSGALRLDAGAFLVEVGQSPPARPRHTAFVGTLVNTNTVEAFREFDRSVLLRQATAGLVAALRDPDALANTPWRLAPFALVVFANLKSFEFLYTAAVPSVVLPRGVELCAAALGSGLPQESAGELPFWEDESLELPGTPVSDGSGGLVAPWPWRNWLLWALVQRPAVKVVARGRAAPQCPLEVTCLAPLTAEVLAAAAPTGWDRDARGRIALRRANLRDTMDPARLADDGASLNLRLIKWRQAPALDLDRISGQRCLLLGAGTLGCYLARLLVAWGVRHVTLVDGARVSHSNPVRQPLFSFSDAVAGAPKAVAAAQALSSILPSVNARGVEMDIPMPGHDAATAGGDDAVVRTVTALDALVADHTAVFLLLDSREARWLPTVLGARHKKLVINVALGFDSFVAMRHGVPGADDPLGCYFCNDVVAPANSTSRRELDQQCTVSRPGAAAVACGLAVELFAAACAHPLGALAPATTAETSASPLGAVPHQIRGSLASFSTQTLIGRPFQMCTACSPAILEAYSPAVVLEALRDPLSLERLTGLATLKADMDATAASTGDDWVF